MCKKTSNMNDEVIMRNLRTVLQNGMQEIERYIDKVSEIIEAIANKYLRRLCRIMKKIDQGHCRGLLPMAKVMSDMSFVHYFIDLMNKRLEKPGDFSETTIIPLFDGQCCVDMQDKDCPEIGGHGCSEEHELILIDTMKKHFKANILDIQTSIHGFSADEKLGKSLCQQYVFFKSMTEETEKIIAAYNKNATEDGKKPFEKTEGNIYEYKNHPINGSPHPELNPKRDDIGKDIVNDMITSKTYTRIKEVVTGELGKVETSLKYIIQRLPILVPCTLYGTEKMDEKALIICIEVNRMGKYLFGYVILKSIAVELKNEHFEGYPLDKDNYHDCPKEKDMWFDHDMKAKKDKCMLGPRGKLMDTIYQRIFGSYHDETRMNKLYTKREERFGRFGNNVPVIEDSNKNKGLFGLGFGGL